MKESDNFWIPISFTNSETTEKLHRAIAALQQVHNWTVEYLNGYWLDNLTMPAYKDFRPDLEKYIKREKLLITAQRYSILRAAEQTFPYVSESIFLDGEGKVCLAPPREIDSIQIESRKVWRKYLAKGYGITTGYGTIFLEGKWKETLRQQAEGTPIDLIPFLWHSLTIKHIEFDRWKAKFNLHSQYSKFGDEAKKELEKVYP